MTLRLHAALAMFALFTGPAFAGDAFDMPVTGAVLPGWERADGSRIAALHLTLAPEWKTYWRAPGDGGIPPQIDWSGSKNLQSVAVTWPTPEVFYQSGMRSLGYEDELVLPITLTHRQAGQPVQIKATLDIGVCRDICIPHQMTLTATIDDTNTSVTPKIAAALANTPYSAKEAGVSSATCTLRPSSDGMVISAKIAMPPAGGKEVVVIEPGGTDFWMSETDVTRAGRTLTATGDLVAGSGGAIALDRSKIRITVLGQNHAVDIRGCPAG